ncbi:MAG: response regulator [Candidatus Hydrogenedentes bacterium]|nr:response regulator [Candidatus Hydrogenedentota bacterium]
MVTDQLAGNDTTPPAPSILVVEDNIASQRIAVLMLQRLGCRCDVSHNGLEAITATLARGYDLVLMDLQLPDMCGAEAARQIRQNEKDGVRTPIVAMTAEALHEDREKCVKAGMDGFLSKPVSLDALREALARHLCVRSPAKSRPSETGASELVDIARIRSAANGDIALERELIDLFLADSETRLDSVELALMARNITIARREIHTIKGASGSVGANEMQQRALDLEGLNDVELADTSHPALRALNMAFAATREFLLHHIEEREAASSQVADSRIETVFAYGTLLDSAVQVSLFGRILTGASDALTGYKAASVTQDGQTYPNLAPDKDGRINGVLLELTPHELATADAYEGEPYSRIRVLTDAGRTAWLYIAGAPGD